MTANCASERNSHGPPAQARPRTQGESRGLPRSGDVTVAAPINEINPTRPTRLDPHTQRRTIATTSSSSEAVNTPEPFS